MKRLTAAFLFVFITTIFTACAPGKLFGPKLTPTLTFTPTQTSTPTNTATPTSSPTPTSTPTPIRPSIPAPVVPEVSAPISVDNANQLTRLISLGEGNLRNIQLSPDGKWIVLGTENGLLVLNPITLKRVLFLQISIKPTTISFIENETKIIARDSNEGYIWTIPDGKLISHVHFTCVDATKKNNYCESFPDDDMEYAFGLSYSVVGIPATTYSNFLAGLYRTSDGEIQYLVDYKVKKVFQSPDTKLLALCTDDKLVLLQFQDGKVITEIPAIGNKSVFFFPDGKTLALVFQYQIKYFSMVDFHLIDTVDTGRINSYFFSPDNSVLVVMTPGKFIQLFRAEDGLLINGISGISLTFSPDNQGFIVDDGAGRINYYQLASDRSRIDFRNAFSGHGVYHEDLYYKYYDNFFGSYYSQNAEPNFAGVFSADGTKILVLNPGDKNLGSSLQHAEILVYDISTGSLINRYPDFSYPLYSGALWLPSLNTFTVLIEELTAGTSFVTLDLQSGSFTKIIDYRTVTRQAVNFSTKSDLLVTARGNTVLSWDLKNNGYWQLPVTQNDAPDSRTSRKIAFSPDDKILFFSDSFGKTQLINSANYSVNQTPRDGDFIFFKNGYYGWTNGQEIFIDSEQGSQIYQFVANNTNYDFNSAKNLLATVSIDGLKVWDLSDITREKILFSDKLTKNVRYFGSVCFSPDGNYVAAESDSAVTIWRTNDGQVIYKIGTGFWMEFAFSADSKMIAISSQGGFDSSQVSIFDLSTGKSIFSTGSGSFQGSSSNPPKISFSPDGKYMAILPAFGFVSIWGIP